MFGIVMNDPRPWYKQVVSGVLKTVWGFAVAGFWLFCLAAVLMMGATVYTFHTEILTFFAENWWKILLLIAGIVLAICTVGLYEWATEIPEEDDDHHDGNWWDYR